MHINQDQFERSDVYTGGSGNPTWNTDWLFAVNKNDVARMSVWKQASHATSLPRHCHVAGTPHKRAEAGSALAAPSLEVELPLIILSQKRMGSAFT